MLEEFQLSMYALHPQEGMILEKFDLVSVQGLLSKLSQFSSDGWSIKKAWLKRKQNRISKEIFPKQLLINGSISGTGSKEKPLLYLESISITDSLLRGSVVIHQTNGRAHWCVI